MMDIGKRWKSVTNRENWAAGSASFVAKVKATKTVWFPPRPDERTTKAAATAKKATAKASPGSKKAAKKPAKAGTRKTAKKATNAAKKST